jgi:hypothetical protein
MTIATIRGLVCSVVLLGVLSPARPLHAQIGVGTWVRKATGSTLPMTMTVEACCNGGRRLIYHFGINGTETILSVESAFDGSEAQVLIAGKPSGETMAITRVDDHHTSTVVKLNGKEFGTSKATLSADGKVLTVVNVYSSSVGGQTAGTSTETWTHK